jgi:hypothetical protein
MKLLKRIALLFILSLLMNSCASGYKMINPDKLNYNSRSEKHGITLEYKYNLLDKKYAKKETKKGIRLVAIKIQNNSDKDLIFGKDLLLINSNGSQISIYENERTFSILKQKPATYLWYLLLTPMSVYTSSNTNTRGGQTSTNSIPVGLVVGPGLAGGNYIAASSANKKFESEILDFDIIGRVIKKGETVHGLIGIISDNYESLNIKLE